MSEKGILKKIDDIFNYCEEIDNHLPKEEQTGYEMLPDIFYIQKEVRNLQQKVEQLEKENEYLKMSNPEQNIEHFRIVNENKRKIDMLRKENHQLEKEVNKYQKELEKADSITQSCIFQGKQESKISFRKCLNRLEQLENIRKEAIVYIKDKMELTKECPQDLLNILNKGGISKYE